MHAWAPRIAEETRYFHCDPSGFRVATSYLTGRRVITNTSDDRFLLSPDWQPEMAYAAVANVEAENASRSSASSRALKLLTARIQEARTPEQLTAALENLIDFVGGIGIVRTNARNWEPYGVCKRIFVALWAEAALAFPAKARPFPRAQLYKDTTAAGKSGACLENILKAHSEGYKGVLYQAPLTHHFLKRLGFVSPGDLTPETCVGMEDDFPAGTDVTIAKTIYSLQVGEFGTSTVTHHPEDIACPAARAKTYKSFDSNFSWLDREDPRLELWRDLASEWTSNLRTAKVISITILNRFFRHALSVADFPMDPRDYLSRRTPVAAHVLFQPENTVYTNKFREFIEWVLETKCSIIDDNGLPYPSADHWNPHPAAKHKKNRPETHRQAMPTLLVRLALEILTEDDWAWSRAVGSRNARGGDTFLITNPDGQVEKVWAPARAVAMWLKLRMPFRTLQVRLLDSGEADTFIYDYKAEAVKPNTTSMAQGSAREPLQRGVIQSLFDRRAGQNIFMLRLNTNKTDDIDRDARERGYDCPYAPEDVVQTLGWLADWQRAFNPISGPTPWTEVQELRNKYTLPQLEGLETCFLFRDAASSNRAEPLMPGRLGNFWALLMHELQQRLEARGIRQPDGKPYVLVTDDVKSPVFDLHELRVTGITSLYENGLPIEILMKIVGHAAVVMTLYYAKIGEYEIQRLADEASAQAMRNEQRNWTSFQRQQALTDLRSTVAWNDESGLATFSEGAGTSLVVMDTGICPVGCSKCHIGGERLKSTAVKESRWRPVVGGRSNCPSCRFFISGPPFLHGLIARFNELSASANVKARKRSELEASFELLDAERRLSESRKQPFLKYREWQRASNDFDSVTSELDGILMRLNAVARVVEQCKALLSIADRTDEAAQLIVRDAAAFEVSLEETSDFDLLDRICISSEIFGSVDASEPNVRRQRAYDRMLIRNGLPPAFLDLDDRTSLRVGNQLSRILTVRVGRPNTVNLMEGSETLARLGLSHAELERFLLEETGQSKRRLAPPITVEAGGRS